MINIGNVMVTVKDSKAVLNDRRKSLLSFTEKYLAQIEGAEKKITEKTNKQYVDRVNDQRLFIDSLIDYLQETDNCTNLLESFISDMLEFYEAELLKGGRICHDVQFWKNQAIRMSQAKKRIIKAFSGVLSSEQNDKLFKILTE
jgi:hypothetical protein